MSMWAVRDRQLLPAPGALPARPLAPALGHAGGRPLPQRWRLREQDLRLQAVSIDTKGQKAQFKDGSSQRYDQLLIATGSR